MTLGAGVGFGAVVIVVVVLVLLAIIVVIILKRRSRYVSGMFIGKGALKVVLYIEIGCVHIHK